MISEARHGLPVSASLAFEACKWLAVVMPSQVATVVAGLPAGNPPTQIVLESVLGNIHPMLQGCLLLWSMNLLSCPSVANLIEVPGANPTSQQPQHPLSLSVDRKSVV